MSKDETAIIAILEDYLPMAQPETLIEIARKILDALEEQALESTSNRSSNG